MPNNEVSDPITDQEIAFAHLVLSATMTDRQAAEVAGLDPDTAADTKAKPQVHAYMLEHRAAVREQLVQTETDLSRRAVEGLHRTNIGRERVLTRLWTIANLSPEMTRSSVTGQVKALSMIIAIECLIPDRRAGSLDNKSVPPPAKPNTYVSAWLRALKAKSSAPQPSPALVPDEEPEPSPAVAADTSSDPGPTPSPAFASNECIPVHPAPETTPSSPYARVPDSAPDLRLPFHIQQKNRFGRRR
jgi:hypothetical protein